MYYYTNKQITRMIKFEIKLKENTTPTRFYL